MTPSTWPDPQRGGVPMEPEKDGWHWLGYIYAPETFPKLWLLGRWCHAGGGSWVEAAEVAKTLRYIAPCPPPELIRTDADLATTASVHAAAGFEAGLEASAQWHDREVAKWLREAKKHTRLNGVRSDCEQRDLQRAAEHHKHAAALRALPIPDASALEAAIKEAEERGARKADALVVALAKALDRVSNEFNVVQPTLALYREHGAAIAAIRARASGAEGSTEHAG